MVLRNRAARSRHGRPSASASGRALAALPAHGACAAGPLGPRRATVRAWTVHAEDAWASSTGTGQIVGVVDTGADATHPDLAGRVLSGAEFTTQSDTSTGDGTNDDNGHGTHVSGIVAAVANNATGVAGLAP